MVNYLPNDTHQQLLHHKIILVELEQSDKIVHERRSHQVVLEN